MNTENRADVVLLFGILSGITALLATLTAFMAWYTGFTWKIVPAHLEQFWSVCGWLMLAGSLLGSQLGCLAGRALIARTYPGCRLPSKLTMVVCAVCAPIMAWYPFSLVAHICYLDPPYFLLPVLLVVDVVFFFLARNHLRKPIVKIPYRGGGQQF